MIITDKKIKVTDSMMTDANMTKFGQLGIPKDPKNPNKGLVWKSLFEITDEDFDKIEQYFINND